MPLAVESTNTQTAVLGTEHTLATPITSGIRQLRVFLNNLVAGEAVEIRVKVPQTVGGTLYDEYYQAYVAPLNGQTVETVAISSDVGCSFTLKQLSTAGAVARQFLWKVYTL